MAADVKICGLTRPVDAALAGASGAKWLGVIFASGPRVIDVDRAREIVAASGGTPVIGVFALQSINEVLDTAGAVGLAGAQLQRSIDGAGTRRLHEAGLLVWRVVAISEDSPMRDALAQQDADAVVVEARVPGGSGGKGIPIALEVARRARDAVGTVPFVLAGGLRPDTVAEAIRLVRPDVVDVSSGVESAPGIKDAERLTRFLENARAANAAA